MSDNLEDFETGTDGGQLRKQLEAALKKNKELETQVTKFSEAEKQRQVTEALGGQGFKNPKRVSQHILADGIDPSDTDAVANWLKDNGDDYAKATASPETPPPESQQQQPQEQPAPQKGPDAATVDAYQRITNLTQEASPESASALDAVKQKVTDKMSPQEVHKMLVEQGL